MSQDNTESARIKPRRPEHPLPYVPELFPKMRPDWGLTEAGQGVPTQEDCAAIWDKYGVWENIREHSKQVALIVAWLGAQFQERGVNVNRPLILAGALLHDLAKSYTIQHGGNHAQLGAGWVVQETGNYQIAQMVYHHVNWPWEPDLSNESMLPALLLVYADKRVKHDRIVPLEERFEDLFKRYGHNELSRSYIAASREQGILVEQAISKRLGVAVNEYSFDCRRLV